MGPRQPARVLLGYCAHPVAEAIYRARISAGEVEQIVSVTDIPLARGVAGFWIGLTPEDVPLLLRDNSRHDLYALDRNVR
jgi:hypothetical protein